MKKIIIPLIGGIFLLLLVQLGDKLAQLFNLPLPGSMVGTILLFILLLTKVIRLAWIESCCDLLLNHLLLFFIPAAVGIMKYQDLLASEGMQLILLITLSTALVMISTGLSAEHLHHFRKGRKE